LASCEIETRTQKLAANGGNTLAGYAAVFNSPAVIAGQFVEIIAPSAFANSLKANDVVALMAHDTGRVLGRTSSGTLTLAEDKRGLSFSLDIDPSTPDGATALGLVRRRDIAGCSFGFQVRAEAWRETDGLPVRTLEEIDLFEITLTAWPAYQDTTVALRSMERNKLAWAAHARMSLAMKVRGLRP